MTAMGRRLAPPFLAMITCAFLVYGLKTIDLFGAIFAFLFSWYFFYRLVTELNPQGEWRDNFPCHNCGTHFPRVEVFRKLIKCPAHDSEEGEGDWVWLCVDCASFFAVAVCLDCAKKGKRDAAFAGQPRWGLPPVLFQQRFYWGLAPFFAIVGAAVIALILRIKNPGLTRDGHLMVFLFSGIMLFAHWPSLLVILGIGYYLSIT